MRSCWDPGIAVIHFWLQGYVCHRPQRVTSAGSSSRCETLWPDNVATVAAAATAGAAAAAAAAAV